MHKNALVAGSAQFGNCLTTVDTEVTFMSKKILVIGGTRYFGKLLVAGLLRAGHDVTIATRGRAADGLGERVRRVCVDRRDAAAMASAFASGPAFDLVYDQVCYSPLDAAIAADVFAGKVGRYVVASTIEVYSHLHGALDRPFREGDVDLGREPIDMAYPWHEPAFAEASYGKGKRQAEAYFYRDGRLPVASARIGHVLAGPEDFTGRLASYVKRALEQRPLWYGRAQGQSSFISAPGISEFLLWLGGTDARGPINAAAPGTLSALDIQRHAARVLRLPLDARPVSAEIGPSELSPFDFPGAYTLDMSRATSLGYRFDHDEAWLDPLIREHARALSTPAALGG